MYSVLSDFLVDLPGVEKSNIHVELTEGLLSVSGEKKENLRSEDANVIRSESKYGYFHRSFRLPPSLTEADAKASYQNGVLNITVPKLQEKVLVPNRIAISDGEAKAAK